MTQEYNTPQTPALEQQQHPQLLKEGGLPERGSSKPSEGLIHYSIRFLVLVTESGMCLFVEYWGLQ